MTKPIDLDSLHEVLSALVDQRMTDEQNARLQQTLKLSSEARQLYLDFIDIHFGLRKLERMEREVDPITDFSKSLKTKNVWSRLSIVSFATAASLLIGLSVLLWQVVNPLSSATPIANLDTESSSTNQNIEVRLAQAVRASFFSELTPSLNSKMKAQHEYALITGMIELHFPTGATAIIEAPAVFLIVSASRLKLQTGQCSVHAPEGAEGFQVETPLTSIVDLGTRFSVSVDETGGTDVQVVEGIAEVIASNGTSATVAQPMRLTDRQARTYLERGDVVSQAKEYDDSQYRSQLPDRIVSYHAAEPNGRGAVELVEVNVQRGGEVYAYPIDSLIGIELTHFKSATGKNIAPIAYSLDDDDPKLEKIIADRALNTGAINPGGAVKPLQSNPVMASTESEDTPNTPGMAIRFRYPIVNDLGPDIVVFDLQTFTNPPGGDAFHIGPVSFEPGLRSHTVRTFDITLNSKEAKVLENFGLLRYPQRVNSLDELTKIEPFPSRAHMLFRALAVGIDLSDLGYAAGATVDHLFIQDALDDSDSFVDPTTIVGLPRIKSMRH